MTLEAKERVYVMSYRRGVSLAPSWSWRGGEGLALLKGKETLAWLLSRAGVEA